MKKWWIILPLVLLLIGGAAALVVYKYVKMPYEGADVRLYISRGSTETEVTKLLADSLGDGYASHVTRIWKKRGDNIATTSGSYVIRHGETALQVASKLRSGNQTPVRVTIGAPRTFDEVAKRIASQLDFTEEDFIAVCDSILPSRGFTQETYPAAILPDTYEFYWNVTPEKALDRLLRYRNDFWNDERRAKASKLNLSPVQVATLASIVEEETARSDERPTVARLYLNRLNRGMKLQADPTVKFAVGDPTLKRILYKHLETESPYNTYLHEGLPPGPIRVPEKTTLDAVLNAPAHNYIYMCAREDFSGYHYFETTLSRHNANARKYQLALDGKNIRR